MVLKLELLKVTFTSVMLYVKSHLVYLSLQVQIDALSLCLTFPPPHPQNKWTAGLGTLGLLAGVGLHL